MVGDAVTEDSPGSPKIAEWNGVSKKGNFRCCTLDQVRGGLTMLAKVILGAVVVLHIITDGPAREVYTRSRTPEDSTGRVVTTGVTRFEVTLTPADLLAIGAAKASNLQDLTLYDDTGTLHHHRVTGTVGPVDDGSFVLLVGTDRGIQISDGPHGPEWKYVHMDDGGAVVYPRRTTPRLSGKEGTGTGRGYGGNYLNIRGRGRWDAGNDQWEQEPDACGRNMAERVTTGDWQHPRTPRGGCCQCLVGYIGMMCTACDTRIAVKSADALHPGCVLCSDHGSVVNGSGRGCPSRKYGHSNDDDDDGDRQEGARCICEEGWTGGQCEVPPCMFPSTAQIHKRGGAVVEPLIPGTSVGVQPEERLGPFHWSMPGGFRLDRVDDTSSAWRSTIKLEIQWGNTTLELLWKEGSYYVGKTSNGVDRVVVGEGHLLDLRSIDLVYLAGYNDGPAMLQIQLFNQTQAVALETVVLDVESPTWIHVPYTSLHDPHNLAIRVTPRCGLIVMAQLPTPSPSASPITPPMTAPTRTL